MFLKISPNEYVNMGGGSITRINFATEETCGGDQCDVDATVEYNFVAGDGKAPWTLARSGAACRALRHWCEANAYKV
jgi:hypothetical protein